MRKTGSTIRWLEFLPTPDRLEPLAAGVHVWRGDLDQQGWPGPDGLPADERERAAAILRPLARRRWVASRWLLRGVLARYLGRPGEDIRLEAGEHGKPRLAEPPAGSLAFNLSHSESLALVALAAGREVGVDVERITAEREPVALAEKGLGPEGAAAVRAAPESERSRVFHRRWADHEARLKCLGIGLSGEPPEAAALTVLQLDLGPNFAASVAVNGDPTPLRQWTFGPTAPNGRNPG